MKRIAIAIVAAIVTGLTTVAQTPITIHYDGSTASVDIPAGITDVTATTNGANVSIQSTTTSTEYTYRVTGYSADGSLTFRGAYKMTLQLAGVELTNSHGGAAVDVECGKRIAVELVEGTVNDIADSPSNTLKGAIYFSGHPEFQGGGTLNVTGHAKHAIAAKEYCEIKSSTGIINILGAASDGIHCGKGKVNNANNYFLMKGGVVNILNVGSDGVDTDDYGVIRIEGGHLSINVGDGATGLKADSIINIKDGNIGIHVSGTDSEGLRSRYETNISGGQLNIVVTGDGSKGIKGKRYTEGSTVLNGGNVTISGGETAISVLGGSYTDATGDVSKCMGISIDADFTLSDATVSITALGKEAYTYNVKGTENLTGGTLITTRAPWQFNRAIYQYDMTAYVSLPETDTAPLAIGAFIDGQCAGIATFPTSDYGILRIYSNSTDAQAVTFRLYNYDSDEEYDLTPSEPVTFGSGISVGEPSSPLLLTLELWEAGDVNHDGIINIVDVTTTISHILGQTPATFFPAEADVNGDGVTNIVDVTSIIDMILK